MRFEIMGLDRQSGIARREAVECSTEDEARAYAQRRGIVVESIEPVTDDLAAIAAAQHRAPGPAAVVDYGRPASHVPPYVGLRVAGSLIICLAVLGYLVAAFLFIQGLGLVLSQSRPSGMGAPELIPPILIAMGSLIQQGIGQALLVLREIAQRLHRNAGQ